MGDVCITDEDAAFQITDLALATVWEKDGPYDADGEVCTHTPSTGRCNSLTPATATPDSAEVMLLAEV
jgi:hypothetical protein